MFGDSDKSKKTLSKDPKKSRSKSKKNLIKNSS
jgi:hypothetical protein